MPLHISERDRKIFALRKRGMKFATIAFLYGLKSRSRVQQICALVERRTKAEARGEPVDRLTIRAARSLRYELHYRSGVSLDVTPELIAAKFTRSQILDIPNLGRVTCNEIDEWLAFYGLTFREEYSFPAAT